MEISPAYCDVAILRWQRFTRQKAVLDGEDRIFDDIAGGRKTLVIQVPRRDQKFARKSR
jgi:hypothetical protein